MKTIKLNGEDKKYYESLEEAIKNATNPEQFKKFALDDLSEFHKQCEATGAIKLVWLQSDNSNGVDFLPSMLCNGVLMRPRHIAGPKSNCYFYGLEYVYPLDGDRWRYDQPEPQKVGKPTAKALKAWAQYIKDKHAAELAHKEEEQKKRSDRLDENRAKLKKTGFTPYYRYETFEESRKFSCTRGGINCIAEFGNDNKLYIRYEINHTAASNLFNDIK